MHDPMIGWPRSLSLSQPGLGWLYIFSLFPPCPPPQRLLPFTKNRLCETLHIWNKEYIGLGKCIRWPFFDLDPWSPLWHWLRKKMLVFTSKWETLIYSLQNLAAIPPNRAYYLIRFWSNSAGNVFLANFLLKIRMRFFNVKHSLTMQYNRTKGAYRQGNRLWWVDVSDSEWGDFPEWLQTSACRRQI